MLSHLNHAISQDFKVSFSHQGFTFHVVGILAEGFWIKKVHSNSEPWIKTESQNYLISEWPNYASLVFRSFSIDPHRWAPGGSSSRMFSSELVPQWTCPLSEICSVLGSLKDKGCRCLSSMHSKSEKTKHCHITLPFYEYNKLWSYIV